MYQISPVLRSLTIGAIKNDGFRFAVGVRHTLKDEEGSIFKVIITSIRREKEGSNVQWLIFVKKLESLDEGEFLWKVHRQGKESVTEEFELNI